MTEDILSSGDNIVDVIRTAIRKSKMAIMDITDIDSSPNAMYELELLKKERRSATVLIAERNFEIPEELTGSILKYDFDPQDSERINLEFQNQISNYCDRILGFQNIYQDPLSEARRLFEKREYSACIISAFSALEFFVQKEYKYKPDRMQSFFMTIRNILYDSGKEAEYREFLKYRTIRNDIVHKCFKANGKTAKEILFFIDKLFDILNITCK